MKPAILCAAGLCCLFALATPLGGTIIIRKNLAELARESDLVVAGRVESNGAAWNADRTLIWTTTRLSVIEAWKGAASGVIEIKEPGGEVPPLGQVVAGAPRYRAGDTVVVFLKKDVLGQLRTHGWVQGQFTVATDPARKGSLYVVPAVPHVVADYFKPEQVGAKSSVDYEAFHARVTALAAAKPEERR